MAVNMHLKIEGPPVLGESVVRGHEQEIDVLSCTWKMNQTGSMHSPTGGAGKVTVEDLHISKKVDRASPILMAYCCSGKHFERATLSCSEAGGDMPVQYWTLTMEKVIIKTVATEGILGDERLNESVCLDFAKYRVEYIHQQALGEPGPAVVHTWDIAKNEP